MLKRFFKGADKGTPKEKGEWYYRLHPITLIFQAIILFSLCMFIYAMPVFLLILGVFWLLGKLGLTRRL